MSKQAIVFTVIIVYLLFRALFIEPNSIKITKYEVENNILSGVRIAYLSDLHLKKTDYKRLDKIVKLTNKEKPDLLFIGGNFVKYPDKPNKNMASSLYAGKLNLIKATRKYAVLGGIDWKMDESSRKTIVKDLEKNNIKVLENSPIRTVIKNRYLDIIGVKDFTTGDANVARAMKKTRLPRIVLTNHPDVYYDIWDDVTLILAGGTHGGQIVIPMMPPLFVPSRHGVQFASGLKAPRVNPIAISRGLGTYKVPFRLNCNPEIVIIDFVKVGHARKTR